MSNTKHTPGPWAVTEKVQTDKNMCPVPYYEINSTEDILWVAHVSNGSFKENGEGLSNAKLIAAAPELLEAAQTMVEEIGNGIANEMKAYDKLKAAIKKATE